jgi:predicted  nucleic acid-binding Zn-ribbon protein
MQKAIDNLLALQRLQSQSSGSPASSAEQVAALRREIPESLLRTYDRFAARDKKSVALVRHGVCSECHLQIATGVLGALAFEEGVQQCGNCGRFLYLPEEEPVFPRNPSPPPKAGKSRKRAMARG